jgi:hypothetical protein
MKRILRSGVVVIFFILLTDITLNIDMGQSLINILTKGLNKNTWTDIKIFLFYMVTISAIGSSCIGRWMNGEEDWYK